MMSFSFVSQANLDTNQPSPNRSTIDHRLPTPTINNTFFTSVQEHQQQLKSVRFIINDSNKMFNQEENPLTITAATTANPYNNWHQADQTYNDRLLTLKSEIETFVAIAKCSNAAPALTSTRKVFDAYWRRVFEDLRTTLASKPEIPDLLRAAGSKPMNVRVMGEAAVPYWCASAIGDEVHQPAFEIAETEDGEGISADAFVRALGEALYGGFRGREGEIGGGWARSVVCRVIWQGDGVGWEDWGYVPVFVTVSGFDGQAEVESWDDCGEGDEEDGGAHEEEVVAAWDAERLRRVEEAFLDSVDPNSDEKEDGPADVYDGDRSNEDEREDEEKNEGEERKVVEEEEEEDDNYDPNYERNFSSIAEVIHELVSEAVKDQPTSGPRRLHDKYWRDTFDKIRSTIASRTDLPNLIRSPGKTSSPMNFHVVERDHPDFHRCQCVWRPNRMLPSFEVAEVLGEGVSTDIVLQKLSEALYGTDDAPVMGRGSQRIVVEWLLWLPDGHHNIWVVVDGAVKRAPEIYPEYDDNMDVLESDLQEEVVFIGDLGVHLRRGG